MLPTVFAWALIPLYAAADRFVGGGAPKLDDKLPGRSVFWAALACIILGYLVGGLACAALGLIWGLYRSVGFKHGALAPVDLPEALRALVRHLIIIPPVLAVVWIDRQSVLGAAWVAGLYVFFATALAMANGATQGRSNTFVELSRGAAFGAALAVFHLTST